jgi:hypothetical protein
MLNFSRSSGLAGSILKVNSAAVIGNKCSRPAPCTSGSGASVVADPIAETIANTLSSSISFWVCSTAFFGS